ncbi:MAG TPA: lipopolysaccharide biosynthesis protein [Candidatus Dormibacteraeota bacterium]|nr:lipopolysaccharide biosynthesis protein [Candidatus Dormibacteraeota bacterium]
MKTEDPYNVPRGTAFLTSQQLMLYITYLIFYALLARILNKLEVGQFAVLALIQALFVGIVSGSLPSAATRFISRCIAGGDPKAASGVARTTLRLSLAVVGPAVVIAAFFSPLLGGFLEGASDPTNLLLVTFVSSLFADLMLLYAAFYIGVGRYAQTLYQNLLFVPLSRGLGLFLAYFGFRVLGIMLGWALGGAVTILFSMYMWHGQLPKGGSYPLKPILSFSLPVFASALITLGQQWGDMGIVYVLLGATALGPYYLVVSSVGFLSVLWTPVNQAIYPALSASHAKNDVEGVSERLASAFRLINRSALPIGAALAAISPTALEIVYGPDYVGEALTMSILSLSSVLLAQGALLVTTLQAVGRIRQYLVVTLTSTLIFIAIVAIGAPLIGTVAGAIGRAVLFVLIVVLSRFSLSRAHAAQTNSSMKKAIPLAACVSLPMLALDQFFLYYYHPSWLRPSLQLGILFVLFVILFAGFGRRFKAFHHADIAMLHDALPQSMRPFLKRIERIIISEDRVSSGVDQSGPGGI